MPSLASSVLRVRVTDVPVPPADDASAERRLYTGVQGEGKTLHGDLWGVKNIFALSDNFSLTQKSIERANLAELEYALRNSSIFETDDGKVADLDEPDAEEVVAGVTGYSKKADPTNRASPLSFFSSLSV